MARAISGSTRFTASGDRRIFSVDNSRDLKGRFLVEIEGGSIGLFGAEAAKRRALAFQSWSLSGLERRDHFNAIGWRLPEPGARYVTSQCFDHRVVESRPDLLDRLIGAVGPSAIR